MRPFPGNVIPQEHAGCDGAESGTVHRPGGPVLTWTATANFEHLRSPRCCNRTKSATPSASTRPSATTTTSTAATPPRPIVKIQGTPVSPTNNGALYSWGTPGHDRRHPHVQPDADQRSAPQLHARPLQQYRRSGIRSHDGRRTSTPHSGAAQHHQRRPADFQRLFPGKSLGGGGSTATGFGGAGSTNVDDREERYAITDIVYKKLGAQSLKFGVDVSHALQNVIPLYGAFGGVYAFGNPDQFDGHLCRHRRQSRGPVSCWAYRAPT